MRKYRFSPVEFLAMTFLMALFAEQGFAQQATTPSIRALFMFHCNGNSCPTGMIPTGLLTQASDGNFYGVASRGGQPTGSAGVVFRITSKGVFTSLFNFIPGHTGKFPYGKFPNGSLVEGPDGFLYGTTSSGGIHGAGTIFKMSKGGNLQVLYAFCSATHCADGSMPTSLLLANDGNFYGTTTSGGRSNSGTVFRMSPSGTIKTLHSLNGIGESASPNGLIQAADGNFYATTGIGGSGSLGTIFRVTHSGSFTTLRDFGSPPDADPLGRLLQASDGNLYGATFYGELFKSSLTGVFQIITPGSFDPVRGGLLQASDGNLWGAHEGVSQTDAGDIFSTTITGEQLQQVRFNCALTGGMPQGIIQGTDGKLYGVAKSCVDDSGIQNLGAVFVVDAGLPTPGTSE